MIIYRQGYACSLNESAVVTQNGYRLLAFVTAAAAMEFLPLVARHDIESALSITVKCVRIFL